MFASIWLFWPTSILITSLRNIFLRVPQPSRGYLTFNLNPSRTPQEIFGIENSWADFFRGGLHSFGRTDSSCCISGRSFTPDVLLGCGMGRSCYCRINTSNTILFKITHPLISRMHARADGRRDSRPHDRCYPCTSYRAHGGAKGVRGLIVLLPLKTWPLTRFYTSAFPLSTWKLLQ